MRGHFSVGVDTEGLLVLLPTDDPTVEFHIAKYLSPPELTNLLRNAHALSPYLNVYRHQGLWTFKVQSPELARETRKF